MRPDYASSLDTLPDPDAVARMDGFDELPPSLRDMCNYGVARPNGNGEFRQLIDLVRRHGERRVAAALSDALAKADATPHAFAKDRRQ